MGIFIKDSGDIVLPAILVILFSEFFLYIIKMLNSIFTDGFLCFSITG